MSDRHTSEKHHTGQVPSDVFLRLIDRSAKLVMAADKRDVTMQVAFQNGYVFSQDGNDVKPESVGFNEERFAASHAKLAVGAYVVRRLNGSDDGRMLTLEAMLRESDNDAMRTLVDDNPSDINEETWLLAGTSTRALTIRANGSYYGGQTTAPDSMRMMAHLLHSAKRSGVHDHVARMLQDNTSQYGVKRALTTGPVHLLNKTGDYYGHDDPEVGEAVHHDVGVIYVRGDDPRNDSSKRILYAVTTSADSKAGAVRADGFVRLVGSEMVAALTGARPRLIGARALSAMPG